MIDIDSDFSTQEQRLILCHSFVIPVDSNLTPNNSK